VSRAFTVLLAAPLLVACGGGSTPPVAPAARPVPPPLGARYLAGGDSRNDHSHVIPWAFAEAKARQASGFFFLGDMELTPELDRWFRDELAQLDPVAFFPVLGNHEIQNFGFLPIGVAAAEKSFRAKFLDRPRTPVKSALPDKVVYSADLPGGVHFVALDNVTQHGFGPDQMTWLADDLARAHADAATKHIIIGMHKPLAHNGVSPHGMEHDGAASIADSDAALALFQKNGVQLILMSHVHQFAKLELGGIPAYVTGGLGAPLDAVGPEKAFHHFLQIDATDGALEVTVVKFDGTATVASEAETEED
jgi:3',5'-cyclic AMP phosphodiesterase CpdA